MVPPTAVANQTAESAVSTKDPVKDTILTPRFYTTDFEAMAAMDLRPNEAELEAICEEFRKDYNRHHFVRMRNLMGLRTNLTLKREKYLLNSLSKVAHLSSLGSCSTKN
jgi:magnesium-protoporphyrin IX monomethyl ester (oxidative) cyclase